MSCFEENLRRLSVRYPEVARAVTAAQADPDAVSLLTPRGVPSASVGGTLLHSRYDPAREAAQQVDREVPPHTTAAIVLGLGLGYAVRGLRARHPSLPILVAEASPALFRFAMETVDLGSILEDPALVLVVGGRPEAIASRLADLPLARPAYLRLRPALEREPAWYRGAEEVIQSWFLRREINTNTLKRFGRLWVRNLARNLPALGRRPGVQELRGLFQGIPALVVAGGPSLDEMAVSLPEMARRCVVIAVNTPLKACVRAGVDPDFTILVDPQYWASRSLDWAGSTGSILVAEPSTHPRALREKARATYLCSSLFPLGEWLERATGAKGKLGAGGSVTTTAFDLARVLGASPIFVAGLDLGFPGMRTHCRGVFLEDAWLSSSTRVAPLEASSFRYLRDIGLFTVRSAGGGSTPTDRRMLLYKWWFENQAILRPEVRAFTLSSDGAAIEGMPLATVEEVLSLPVRRAEIDARIRETARREAARGGGDPEGDERLAEAVEALVRELSALAAMAYQGHAHSVRLAEALERGGRIEAPLRELDRIDRRILELSARSVAGFLVQDQLLGISQQGEASEGKREPAEVAQTSARLYRGVEESARWQSGLLGQALSELRPGKTPKGS